jgi:ureidoglycolate lyase
MTTSASFTLRTLAVEPLSSQGFAPFGTVITPREDSAGFGPEDAKLDLTRGSPRFYAMRLSGRGFIVTRITRHRNVTQVLASVGGRSWRMAVAPPRELERADAEPAIEDIRAFDIPGDVAVMLYKGTWHAGPLFAEGTTQSFFNLELTDTNVADHHSCDLAARYGTALDIVTA